VIGGLGDAVADVLLRECPAPLLKIGVPDVYGKSGSDRELREHFGLGSGGICAAVLKWMGR